MILTASTHYDVCSHVEQGWASTASARAITLRDFTCAFDIRATVQRVRTARVMLHAAEAVLKQEQDKRRTMEHAVSNFLQRSMPIAMTEFEMEEMASPAAFVDYEEPITIAADDETIGALAHMSLERLRSFEAAVAATQEEIGRERQRQCDLQLRFNLLPPTAPPPAASGVAVDGGMGVPMASSAVAGGATEVIDLTMDDEVMDVLASDSDDEEDIPPAPIMASTDPDVDAALALQIMGAVDRRRRGTKGLAAQTFDFVGFVHTMARA